MRGAKWDEDWLGLMQYGSGLRLGPVNSTTTTRLASLGTGQPLLLTYGQKPVLLVNETHTVLYGVNGSSSISLYADSQGNGSVSIQASNTQLQSTQVNLGDSSFNETVIALIEAARGVAPGTPQGSVSLNCPGPTEGPVGGGAAAPVGAPSEGPLAVAPMTGPPQGPVQTASVPAAPGVGS